MKISVIIPILNEAASIDKLLSYLLKISSKDIIHEIIIVDGGSTDRSTDIVASLAKNSPITVKLVKSPKGRAKQLNKGASMATASVLYFLHADSIPPIHYDKQILNQIEKGIHAGCFRMRFDDPHLWLRFLGWMTRFNSKKCRGGDQSQFISKALFNELNGYNEAYHIYEDNDLIERIYSKKQFSVIPDYVLTSARRYRKKGVWKLQYFFLNIHIRHWLGASADELYEYYKKNVISES